MQSNKPLFFAVIAATILTTFSHIRAQENIPALTPAELDARRQSVVTLESHIAQREERLGRIVTDIRSLDDRV